jgi:hypothetical protein
VAGNKSRAGGRKGISVEVRDEEGSDSSGFMCQDKGLIFLKYREFLDT